MDFQIRVPSVWRLLNATTSSDQKNSAGLDVMIATKRRQTRSERIHFAIAHEGIDAIL